MEAVWNREEFTPISRSALLPAQKPLCCSGSGLRLAALQAGCRWFETGIGHHHNPLDVLQAAVLDAREPRQNTITPPSLKGLYAGSL